MSFDYSKNLERMDFIRNALEDPNTDLDQSLKYYEEGIALYREMKDYLEQMNQKFKDMSEEFEDGNEE